MELFISTDGVITAIYDETLDLSAIGRPRIRRASHVEPDDQGQWFAAIVDGPTLGPFARRSEAISAEVEWLRVHRLQVPVDPGPGSTSGHLCLRGASAEPGKDGIRAGQVVRILPAYQDPGDQDFAFIAIDDESNGRVLVQIQVDLPIKPTQILFSHMIDRGASSDTI